MIDQFYFETEISVKCAETGLIWYASQEGPQRPNTITLYNQLEEDGWYFSEEFDGWVSPPSYREGSIFTTTHVTY